MSSTGVPIILLRLRLKRRINASNTHESGVSGRAERAFNKSQALRVQETVKSWLFSRLRIAEEWHQAASESMLARPCQKPRKGQSSLSRPEKFTGCVCVSSSLEASGHSTGTSVRLKKRVQMPVMTASHWSLRLIVSGHTADASRRKGKKESRGWASST